MTGCKATLTCALNSCHVLFATAGMVANRHKLLLGAAPGKQRSRFAFSFVDEASKHNISVGLDLAAMGSQCLFCGARGQLRPCSHVQLLASANEGESKRQTCGVAIGPDLLIQQCSHAICWPAFALACFASVLHH